MNNKLYILKVYMYVIQHINRIMPYPIYSFIVNDSLCCYIIIFLHLQRYNNIYTHMDIYYFEKTTTQTFYLFTICWFCFWVHVPNGIVNIFKFGIHSLIIFIRKNSIQQLFDQGSLSLVIVIIYPLSSNNYFIIHITISVNQLN